MENQGNKKDFTEELKLKGSELVARIKELVKEGNVRKLVIKKENGDILFEIPLTAGVAVGGAVTLMAPVIAAIGAGAALLTSVRLEIQRIDKIDDEDKKEEREV